MTGAFPSPPTGERVRVRGCLNLRDRAEENASSFDFSADIPFYARHPLTLTLAPDGAREKY